MKLIRKILIATLVGVFFLSSSTYAFLGEDLGLDLYGQIDQNYGDLEQEQYEYELTGQGEADINEVLAPIFADYGITCNIGSSADIDSMISGDNIAEIVARCGGENQTVPALLAERVSNALTYIRSTYYQRAQTKADQKFQIERIGLYSDGNIENSPFDLVEDLIQIDTIIFTEELEYEGVENEDISEDVQDFVDDVFNDPIIDATNAVADEVQDIADAIEDIIVGEDSEGPSEDIIDYLDYHSYVCEPENQSELDDRVAGDIIRDIEGYGPFVFNPAYWEYHGGITSIDSGWVGPTLGGQNLTSEYQEVRDDWPCDSWFCIAVEFETSDYGLAGGDTSTIETVLQNVVELTDKPANASLTQRKQTTNNFELGSIISNLPGMLRGFGIDVSSKPVPILDIENDREESVSGDLFEIENLLAAYYNNQGLDYQRRNDLSIFGSTEHEQKVFQTAGGMPIGYTENRLNELSAFQNALKENNRVISEAVNSEVITKDLQQFSDLFAELEIFALAIEDFTYAFTGNLGEMKKIPTRSP